MPTKQKQRVATKTKAPAKRSTPSIFDFERVSDAIVHQAVEILGPLDGQRILVCAGKGNTGAVALASVAKFLRDGARPSILLAYDKDDLAEDSQLFLKQTDILGLPTRHWTQNLPVTVYTEQELIIDGLLGAKTKGDPGFPLGEIITGMNDSQVPVLAVDVPSGLDPTTGKPGKPTVVALVTLQVSVPTEKLLDKAGALFVGKVVAV